MSVIPAFYGAPFLTRRLVIRSFAIAFCSLLIFYSMVVDAQERNFYLGTMVTMSDIDASLDKVIRSSVSGSLTDGEAPRIDRESAEELGAGVGLIAGFRFPIAYNETYLSIEFDATLDLTDIEGSIDDQQLLDGGLKLEEGVPVTWTIGGEQNFGLTAKLSNQPQFLKPLGINVYALAGVREYRGNFTSDFVSCVASEACSGATTLADVSLQRVAKDMNITGLMVGVGIGKEFPAKTSLRLEARFTQYEDKELKSFFDTTSLDIQSELETRNVEVGIGVTKSF